VNVVFVSLCGRFLAVLVCGRFGCTPYRQGLKTFSPDTSVFSALATFVITALYISTFYYTIPYHWRYWSTVSKVNVAVLRDGGTTRAEWRVVLAYCQSLDCLLVTTEIQLLRSTSLTQNKINAHRHTSHTSHSDSSGVTTAVWVKNFLPLLLRFSGNI